MSQSHKPLRILHLTTHLNIGGVTSYIYMAASRFVRMGHEVYVYSSGGEKKDAFTQKEIICVDAPIRTKNELNPKLLLALPGLIRLIKKEKIDLLHAHSRVTQVLAAAASFFTQVPVITTSHGFYKRRLSRKLFGAWGKRVVAVSPLVAEDLEKNHKVPKNRIRIIQNAIDIEELESRLASKSRQVARAELGIPGDAFVIACVARLVKDKGHEYLVRAAKDLKKKIPNLYLLFIGSGREEKRIKKLIKKCGLEKEARLWPSLPDVTAPLSAMDVFVLPATYREGFGLAMVEAMIAKKPVVATDIWAINTIIRNRINGYLVEPKKKEAIAEALLAIYENKSQAASIAQNGYDIATQLYAIERLVSELETVYYEVAVKA